MISWFKNFFLAIKATAPSFIFWAVLIYVGHHQFYYDTINLVLIAFSIMVFSMVLSKVKWLKPIFFAIRQNATLLIFCSFVFYLGHYILGQNIWGSALVAFLILVLGKKMTGKTFTTADYIELIIMLAILGCIGYYMFIYCPWLLAFIVFALLVSTMSFFGIIIFCIFIILIAPAFSHL